MKKLLLCGGLIITVALAGCAAPAVTPSSPGSPSGSAIPTAGATTVPTAVTVFQPDKMILIDSEGQQVTVTLGMSSSIAGSMIRGASFGHYSDTGDAGSETIANDIFYLTFMPQDQASEYTLSSIGFTDETYATVAGLRVGDSKARMEELYGLNHVRYDPANYVLDPSTASKALGMCYEYAMGDHYLNVLIKNDVVARWSVERYNYDEFSRRLIPPGMPDSFWE